MSSKSYWSYGKVNHKDGALIPEGRVLIDTAKSFVYTEDGLKGVLEMTSVSQSPRDRILGYWPAMAARWSGED